MDGAVFLVALFAVGVLSGGTAAVIGFGIGSLLTPLLTLRLSPELAVAAVALPHLLATAVRYVRHARAVDRPTFLRFGLLSAAGGLAGALLQARLSAPALLAILGALLIATGLASLTGPSAAGVPVLRPLWRWGSPPGSSAGSPGIRAAFAPRAFSRSISHRGCSSRPARRWRSSWTWPGRRST